MTDLKDPNDLRRIIGNQNLHCETLNSPLPLHIYVSLLIGAILAILFILHVAWLGDEIRSVKRVVLEKKSGGFLEEKCK